MPNDEDGPTQPTQPAEGEPVEIPIPSREDVLRDLEKVAKPSQHKRNGDKGSG